MNSSDLTQQQLLQIIAKFFESRGIPYFIVGSMASMVYGEPRPKNARLSNTQRSDVELQTTAGFKMKFARYYRVIIWIFEMKSSRFAMHDSFAEFCLSHVVCCRVCATNVVIDIMEFVRNRVEQSEPPLWIFHSAMCIFAGG